MIDVPDGAQFFGATDEERRIVETLYWAIGGSRTGSGAIRADGEHVQRPPLRA
jgi:hypothetical protein